MFKFWHSPKVEDLDKKLVFSLRRVRVPKLRQFLLLPKLLTTQERWIMRVAGGLLLIALMGLGARLYNRVVAPQARPGGTYKEALVGAPLLINPLLSSTDSERDLASLLYSSLLRYNETGELQGDLAEKWEVQDSGLTYRFTLRQGVKFQDGRPLTSQDVAFTFSALQNPAWRSRLWRSYQGLTVETPDERTVIVKLKALAAGTPTLFTIGILPKHLWDGVDPGAATLAVWNIKPIGSGPFAFKELSKTRDGQITSYRLKRHEQYYGQRPYLAEIEFTFAADFESAVQSLKERTADGVSFVPTRLRGKLPTNGFQVWEIPFPSYTGIFFQDRKSAILKDQKVRQALAAAIDREAIVKSIASVQALATPFINGQIGFTRTIPLPKPDLNRAAALLKETKIKPENLKITLITLDESSYLSTAHEIKRTWETLGFKVTLEAVGRDALESTVLKSRDFEALLYSIVSGRDPDPYPFWHSSQAEHPGINLSSIKVRELDSLAEQGRAKLDEKTRLLTYIEFQKLFLEKVPAIILYTTPYTYAVSNRVRGVALERMATPADRFAGISSWFIRSKPGLK